MIQLTLKEKWWVVNNYTWSMLTPSEKFGLCIDLFGAFVISFAITYTAYAVITDTVW